MKILKHLSSSCRGLLSLAVLSVLLVQSVHAGEPGYGGKPLSDWLLLSLSGNEEAKEAISQIGTNGIPTLIKILSATESSKRRVARSLESKELREGFKGHDADVDDLRSLAVSGFGILGTNAESAIPQLVKLLHHPETQFQAASALAGIGPKGFAIITNAMSDPNLAGGMIVAINQHGGGDPKVVTQLYIQALGSENPIIRGNAADYLANRDPAVAIPALIPILDDKEYYPRDRASIALASYGPLAKAAAPKLLQNFTNHPDPVDLSNLRKIDPELAQDGEIFLVNSGPTNFARIAYTRTVLKDGRELVVGGYIHTEEPVARNRYLSTAQLIDLKTGAWKETGEMASAREMHAAILLSNGKVLVSGGFDDSRRALPSTVLYDPANGKWMKTGSMNYARGNHAMRLLKDGKVLVAGGHDGRELVTADELYDPKEGTWAVVSRK